MRKTVRRHQSHRFFTLCHWPVSRFSLKAFSTPFRMTLEGKSVIIKGTLSVIQSASEESIPVVKNPVSCHQSHRFFTLCHCPVSRFSLKAFSTPFRMTLEGKSVIIKGTLSVIQSASEESIPVVKNPVSCHQSHRFFTLCHCPVSRFSLKAFSTPFRMTLEGKSVIIKGTLSVIQSASEESMPVVRKTVRRHQRNRFFTPCHCSVSRFSHKAFLSSFRMTTGVKGVILNEREGSITVIGKSGRAS